MSSWLLGQAVVATLVDAGVEQVVLCPGSRNTPVSLALADAARQGRLRLHTRTDERVAGFLGLGLAKVAGIAAVVVTSGTAVANLSPAIMEAKAAGVGLLVITADRPATLAGSGANQTGEQTGLFATQVVAQVRLHSADANQNAWVAQLRRGIVAARGLRSREPGPVHVNLFLAEPLVPDAALAGGADALVADHPSADGQLLGDPGLLGAGLAPLRPFEVDLAPTAPPVELPDGLASVVVVGDAPPAQGAAAQLVAQKAGAPLFAEPSSNARHSPNAIPGYQTLLADAQLAAKIQRVLVYGHPTLSRPISRLLAREDVDVVAVGGRLTWPDPGHNVRAVHDAVVLPAQDDGWLAAWHQVDTPAPSTLWSTEAVAQAVVRAGGQVVFGASNPIRAADRAVDWPEGLVGYANRGLAGIDGTIATATGIALASQRPVTALVGDLTFLHDVGALMVPLGQPEPDLRVVVCDDDGGSIFRDLEVGRPQFAADFNLAFAMPHGHDLAAIAAGFGVPTTVVTTPAQLEEALLGQNIGLSVLIALLKRS